jgi:hypothetical protein
MTRDVAARRGRSPFQKETDGTKFVERRFSAAAISTEGYGPGREGVRDARSRRLLRHRLDAVDDDDDDDDDNSRASIHNT